MCSNYSAQLPFVYHRLVQPNQQDKDTSKGSAFFNRHEQGSTWENVIATSEVA